MMQLKVAIILGLLMSLPIVLWQIWLFVRPGLHNNEEKIVKPLLAGAMVLFPIGAAFAYFMVRLVIVVMRGYTVENVDTNYDISKYFSLLTSMMLIFGVIFELPLVLSIAARIGLVTPRMLTQYRRPAYAIMTFASMILTPADPWSMLAALVPMIILYEISVIVIRPLAALREREQIVGGEAT
jgi:sec-independent protein translocase protein TatC